MKKVLDKKGLKYLIDKIKEYVKTYMDNNSLWIRDFKGYTDRIYPRDNRNVYMDWFFAKSASVNGISTQLLNIVNNNAQSSVLISSNGNTWIKGINGYDGYQTYKDNTLQNLLSKLKLATSDDIESIFND